MIPSYRVRHRFAFGLAFGVAISADNQLIAQVGRNPGLVVLADRDGELKTVKELKSELHCCAFSPDGRWLAVGGKSVKVLDVTRRFKRTGALAFPRRYAPVATLAWSPDSTTLAAAARVNRDGSQIAFLDVDSGDECRVGSEQIGGDRFKTMTVFNHMQFLPDGPRLAVAGSGSHHGLLIYDRRDGDVLRPPIPLLHQAQEVYSREAGAELVARLTMIGGDSPIIDRFGCRLLTWRPESGSIENVSTPEEYKIHGMALHPDGQHVALEVYAPGELLKERHVLLMSLEDGRTSELAKAEEFPNRCVRRFAFSPDGQRFVAAANEGGTVLYELKS